MATYSRMIRFESRAGEILWADISDHSLDINSLQGSIVKGFASVEDLLKSDGKGYDAVVHKLLAPMPRPELPIYCVGLNYRSHAKEASMSVPKSPPLWLKPANALANPGEAVSMNKNCAASFPDFEAELVFITAKDCKDVTEQDAPAFILGYTIGNDITCRRYQSPEEQGGQFFYAKAFDKFAPIGPCLVHPSWYEDRKDATLTCAVNGSVLQNTVISEDIINSPARILSYMSQGTTIPAGTAVMTGTPQGVGYFQEPKRQLKDGDEIQASVSGIGTLNTRIAFV